MTVTVLRADARNLPLADGSVDLIVTSPPYWALRSYTDGGEHYDGQIGAEPTPAAYVGSLIECSREWMRVLKPSGSLWVNLGDKYAQGPGGASGGHSGGRLNGKVGQGVTQGGYRRRKTDIPTKSLIGLPWRYAIRCIDDLGLILRAEVIWEKKNGLPESVTDRVRRSHEQWFHFTLQPRYFASVDTIRGPVSDYTRANGATRVTPGGQRPRAMSDSVNPLGSLPGSVWSDQRVSDGPNLIRSILEAVAAGAITTAEGERLWTGQSISCVTSTSPKTDAGNGPATGSRPDTERSPSSALGVKTSPTGSVTGCSSGPSLTGSPLIISAGIPDACDPITSRPSPCERTSDEPIQSAPSVDTDTPSKAPTSTSPPPASSTRSAAPASSPGSDAGESVWQVATQPLKVPAHLGIDHFAAYPMEFPRRIIQGWSPSGICTACGEGRRPVVTKNSHSPPSSTDLVRANGHSGYAGYGESKQWIHAKGAHPREGSLYDLTGEACACPDTSAPTRPSVIVDPFGGTGTTALVAHALGRHGISADMSSDYCRLAQWRCSDPGQIAAALEVPKPAPVHVGQLDLFGAAS